MEPLDQQRDDRRPPFFWIDNRIADHFQQVGAYGLAVYAYLVYRGNKTGKCWPALKTIGAELKISRSTVIRTLSKLKEVGLINIEPRDNKSKSNVYVLLDRSVPQTPQESPTDTPGVSQVDTNKNQENKKEEEQEIAGSKEPASTSKKKSKDDPEINKAITERIEAYIKGLPAAPATNQYGHKTNRQAALDLFKAGYTPEQVTACTRDKSAEDYWQGKRIPLKTVADDIAAWQHAKQNGNGTGAYEDHERVDIVKPDGTHAYLLKKLVGTVYDPRVTAPKPVRPG